jgi:GTP-binding protein HflX
LKQLTVSAGAQAVGSENVRVHRFDPAYLLSRGKCVELAGLAHAQDATGVIFDDDLTPAQQRNLEQLFELKVLDRPAVILDIFARRAKTREGKLQVELAQLNYLMPRLKGKGLMLSRLGGGIGTRGPGETKLEVDRRKIKERIRTLERELKRVRKYREVQRKSRLRRHLPGVAIIGYTNSGKSTLLNTLTNAGVLVEDHLFATLDPTARKLVLAGGTAAVFIDTVGFINKLPPTLVAAFRATLEEITYADLLLHMVDVSLPDCEQQITVTEGVLRELNAHEKAAIIVWNKIDLLPDRIMLNRLLRSHAPSVAISAKTGEGLDDLLRMTEAHLTASFEHVVLRIPYNQFSMLEALRNRAKILELRYDERDMRIEALVPSDLAQELRIGTQRSTLGAEGTDSYGGIK